MDTYTSGSNSSGNYPKQIIAETGWPSEGGNNCGTGKKCPTPTEGSVASTENLNIFLDGWVCESLKNGTTYFYFEVRKILGRHVGGVGGTLAILRHYLKPCTSAEIALGAISTPRTALFVEMQQPQGSRQYRTPSLSSFADQIFLGL